MKSAKPVSTPLASHLKLSKQMCPTTKEEKEGMAKVLYSSAVGSLMYGWCVQDLILLKQLVLLADSLKILEKNTGRQLSEYSGT